MRRIQNFSEANTALAEYVPPAGSQTANYTLDRMRQLMSALGNPQDTYKVVHVAGTSGKTSTSYYMAALLVAAGQKVGLTVSPHIDQVNERVQVNIVPLEEKRFCDELTIFLEIVQKTGMRPTYFELLVALAYWEFARQGVDYAVIEVGLGGLLDGTNVVTSTDKVCIITDIGLDHTNVLGRDLASIATQKTGIIMPGDPVFVYRQTDEVMQVVRRVSTEQSADLHEVTSPGGIDAVNKLPAFQQRNWYLASCVYDFVAGRDHLPQLPAKARTETQAVIVPARMECMVYHDKTLIFDGAHNAQKMHALTGAIKQQFPSVEIAVMLGLVEDKEGQLLPVVRGLAGIATVIIATTFPAGQDIPRSPLTADRIAQACRELDFSAVEEHPQLREAVRTLLNRPEPVLLITGSFYLVSAVRKLLREREL